MKLQRELIHNLIEKDEFLLIILDACRYDFFWQEYDKYFDGKLVKVESSGRDTFEWAKHTFDKKYSFPYVSGAVPINTIVNNVNPGGVKHLYSGYTPSDHLTNIIDTWKQGWNELLGTVPPWKVTQSALNNFNDRMVVHYFQPHSPFIGKKPILGGRGKEYGKGRGNPPDQTIWWRAKNNILTDEELRNAYRENLHLVLTDVAILLQNSKMFDNIVITSDHGNLLGEGGQYAHPRTNSLQLYQVPWFEVNRVHTTFPGKKKYPRKPKILDIGCGNYNRGTIGITDEKVKGIEHLDKYVGTGISENIQVKHIEKELPFKSNHFDVVKIIHCIEHLKHPYEILKEIKRVLKDHGKLLLITPNSRQNLADKRDRSHIFSFTKWSLHSLLSEVFTKAKVRVLTIENNEDLYAAVRLK